MSAIPKASSDWHEGFLNLLPAVQTHAKIQFRRLPADKREEATQEAIAAACMNYQLAAAQGKLHVVCPSTLANFAVRHVRSGRHVGGRQDAAKDVLSPVCHHRYGVQVMRYQARRIEEGTDGWQQIAVANRKMSVPDVAAFRIDFSRWLKTLAHRDRRIIAALIDGHGASFIADRFGITPGRISQLRRKFERLWKVFQGEMFSGEAVASIKEDGKSSAAIQMTRRD